MRASLRLIFRLRLQAFNDARLSSLNQRVSSQRLIRVRERNLERHSPAADPACVARGSCVCQLIVANRSGVLARMSSFRAETSAPVKRQRLVNGPVRAIILDCRLAAIHLQADVIAAPLARRQLPRAAILAEACGRR